MSSTSPNPFLTSIRPCMCGSKKATKDCCGPKRPAYWGEAEALANIGPVLPGSKSYGAFLASIAKLYLREMCVDEADRIQVVLINLEDKEFRCRAIVAREDGQFGRELFGGTAGHDTPEASAQALLFMIVQHFAQVQGEPLPGREEFDKKLEAKWQATQESTREMEAREGST